MHDLERLLAECRDALAGNDSLHALEELAENLPESARSARNEILLHLSRLRSIREEERKGLTTGAEAQAQRNRVTFAVLEFLDELPQKLERETARLGPRVRPVPSEHAPSAESQAISDNPPFDIFLSHNSADKPIVLQLADALKQRGLRVWLDEQDLPLGRPWQPELDRVLGEVRSAAVLVGPSGLGPWERPEMWVCLDEFVRRRIPVIPILLPGLAKRPELPRFLAQFTWIDFSTGFSEAGLDRLAQAAQCRS